MNPDISTQLPLHWQGRNSNCPRGDARWLFAAVWRISLPVALLVIFLMFPGGSMASGALPSQADGEQQINPVRQDPAKQDSGDQVVQEKGSGPDLVVAQDSDPASGQKPATESDQQKQTVDQDVEWPVAEDGWLIVTPPNSNATIHMPLSPRPAQREMVPVEGMPITVHMNAVVDDNQANFVFAWHDQPVPKSPADAKSLLSGAVNGALAMTLGELETSEPRKFGEHFGCEFRIRFAFREQPMRVASRVVLVGGRMFQMTYVAAEKAFSEEDYTRFTGSFLLVPVVPEEPAPAAAGPEKSAESEKTAQRDGG